MSFFGKLIGATIEVVKVPVAIVKDVVTIGGIAVDKDKTFTEEKLDDIKREAQ